MLFSHFCHNLENKIREKSCFQLTNETKNTLADDDICNLIAYDATAVNYLKGIYCMMQSSAKVVE